MNTSRAKLRSILSASLLVSGALALVSAPADADGPSASNLPWKTTLGRCYSIKLKSFETESDYSTYKYRVTERTGCQDLSNWVLALPGCRILAAHPHPWEQVKDEPNTHLTGIKWQTGAGFRSGVFVVRVKGDHSPGRTRVAAKGPDVWYGKIAGPVCR
jgi:hypothetical protein